MQIFAKNMIDVEAYHMYHEHVLVLLKNRGQNIHTASIDAQICLIFADGGFLCRDVERKS